MRLRFDPSVRPILQKEMRSLMRHRRMPAVLFVCAALAVGAGSFMLGTTLGGTVEVSVEDAARLGHHLFGGLMLLEGVLMVLLAPVLTGGAIAGEYERRTMEPLLLSRLSIREIITGKLLAALGVQGIVVLCALPVVAVAFIFGGASPSELLFFLLVLLSVAACCDATGIYLSSRCRGSAPAIALTFCMALAWLVLTVPCAVASLLVLFFETLPASEHEQELSSTSVVLHSLVMLIVGITALVSLFNMIPTLNFLVQFNLAFLCWSLLGNGDSGMCAFVLSFMLIAMCFSARFMLTGAERAIRRRWQGGALA